ncbi:hypothetical protein DAEQUDRAFT_512338 [Daedalea quercina L-15889]|uniref:HNH nuclease domain-containing protein n=1 Tax=Daedalea quercina L-15889 TaxID=1314783 RepID=A0A165TBL2_9APHY|nr:hypothetical protein DAEQUDRAFT_512338 [Daedalea quercina L-15889]
MQNCYSMSQPLPPNVYYARQSWRDAYSTTHKCLHYEHVGNTSGDATSLVRARILGYSVREATSDSGRDVLACAINSCGNDAQFERPATLYIAHFLRCFRAKKSHTPTPSSHPSRPSFDDTQDTLKDVPEEAPRDHTMAKQKALTRDGYRCMLTGAFDAQSVKVKPHIRPASPLGIITNTEAAHIFPESMKAGISGGEQDGTKHNCVATVWAAMARFGDTSRLR